MRNFFKTYACRSFAHCSTCRDLEGGRAWRQSIATACSVPNDAPDFVCPRGLPWGFTTHTEPPNCDAVAAANVTSGDNIPLGDWGMATPDSHNWLWMNGDWKLAIYYDDATSTWWAYILNVATKTDGFGDISKPDFWRTDVTAHISCTSQFTGTFNLLGFGTCAGTAIITITTEEQK